MGAIAMTRHGTTDAPWDGPAAEAAMPADRETLRYCHLWVDPDADPTTKTAYKLPIAREKSGPVNLGACRAVLSRLPSTQIPPGDKIAVERIARSYLPPDSATRGAVTMRTRSPHPDQWWTITNVAGGEADLYISGEIGGLWGVDPAGLREDLAQVTAPRLRVRINSGGGNAFDGVAIYHLLKNHPAVVDVVVEGIAASAASVIAMAGDTVTMASGSSMMIHDARVGVIGDAAALRKTADDLDGISAAVAEIYAERTGVDASCWRERMAAETWYQGPAAVDAGLATAVGPRQDRTTATATAAWLQPLMSTTPEENRSCH
jgi:ATP-dependent protease ClpP protease subunit